MDSDRLPGELIFYASVFDPDFEELEIIPSSDIHYGNPLCSKKHVMRHIDYLAEKPNRLTHLNGDMCESTLKTSKGEIYRQVGSPDDQWQWIAEKFYKVRKQIIGVTDGNHEGRVYDSCGISMSRLIAKELGVPFRAEGMLHKISFGKGNSSHDNKPYVYWAYFTHGYGGARTAAAKAKKVENTSTFIHADIYGMSHDHVVNAAPVIYLIPDNRTHTHSENGFTVGKISVKRKMLVKTNAFVKWGGYAELGGFPPSDLTTPIIKLAGTGKPMVRVLV